MGKQGVLHKEAEVKSLLLQFNESVGEGNGLDVDKVCSELVKQGAGVKEAAEAMSFEDIAACDVPKSLARAIAKLWREGDTAPVAPAKAAPEVQVGGFGGSISDFALALGNVGSLSDLVLIANYDPTGRDDISAELLKRSKGKPFIVFADKATLRVDVERTLGFLSQIKQGIEVGGRTMINGALVELRRPGELPDRALSICPVHTDKFLVGNEDYCDACARSWQHVPFEKRQLAYLQAEEVWADAPDNGDARLVQLHAALQADNDPYLAQAQLEFQKYRDTGRLGEISLVKPIR